MGFRAIDHFRTGVWLALILVLALTVVAQHGQPVVLTGAHHSLGHSDPDAADDGDSACLLACITFVDAVPPLLALKPVLAGDLAAFPWAVLLIGQDRNGPAGRRGGPPSDGAALSIPGPLGRTPRLE
jgi:hypothetical protein